MIRTDAAKCLRCGGCVGVCPALALELSEHGLACSAKCIDCGSCIGFCPVGAIAKIEGRGKQ